LSERGNRTGYDPRYSRRKQCSARGCTESVSKHAKFGLGYLFPTSVRTIRFNMELALFELKSQL